mmetsp:Transcript_28/g.46  ORF Transcript_28/g.46 Transcript_28/m.46 type:complete len:203 (-) Transcript_28:117-725(-)
MWEDLRRNSVGDVVTENVDGDLADLTIFDAFVEKTFQKIAAFLCIHRQPCASTQHAGVGKLVWILNGRIRGHFFECFYRKLQCDFLVIGTTNGASTRPQKVCQCVSIWFYRFFVVLAVVARIHHLLQQSVSPQGFIPSVALPPCSNDEVVRNLVWSNGCVSIVESSLYHLIQPTFGSLCSIWFATLDKTLNHCIIRFRIWSE